MEIHAALEALVRSSFEVCPLPASVLFRIVPDLQCGNRWFGKVRLADCLFSAYLW